MDMFDDEERSTGVPGHGEDEAAADRKLAEIRQGFAEDKTVFFRLVGDTQMVVSVGIAQSFCGGSKHFVSCLLEGLVELSQENDFGERIFTKEGDGVPRFFRDTALFLSVENEINQAKADLKLAELHGWLSAGTKIFFDLPDERRMEIVIGDNNKSFYEGSERLMSMILDGLVVLAENPEFTHLIYTREFGMEKRYFDTAEFRLRKEECERRRKAQE